MRSRTRPKRKPSQHQNRRKTDEDGVAQGATSLVRSCSVVALGEIGLEEVERRTGARIVRGLGDRVVICIGINIKLGKQAVVDSLRDLAPDEGCVDDVFGDASVARV